MEEKQIFIKLDKHKDVNELMNKLEEITQKTKQKLIQMNDLMQKEKNLIESIENSINKTESHIDLAKKIINND